jgi:hypothetical protein
MKYRHGKQDQEKEANNSSSSSSIPSKVHADYFG